MCSTAKTLAVVIPCYNVEAHVEAVVAGLPNWVSRIILVDDASSDSTGALLERISAGRADVTVVHHDRNQGVGGAVVTGFREALRGAADIVVKIDGDGQMDAAMLPALLRPLLEGRAHYAKGNRFRHVAALRGMPRARLLGNIMLTFMTRLASGCWHVFDVQNGFLAITREALEGLPLERVDRSYSFENSMLSLLNIESWPIADVPMPAIYADEISSMSLPRVMLAFPFRLLRMLLHRVVMKYFVYDVSPVFPYLVFGLGFVVFGLIFGGWHWTESVRTGTVAPTGTVVLSLLTFLIGFTLLLQAITLDIANSPRPRPGDRRLRLEDVPACFGA